MYVLGIHDGHNASAALLQDGRIVAAVQEERLRNLKNAMGLPELAIRDVLSQAGVAAAEVEWVALSGLHNSEYVEIDPSVRPSRQILDWHQAAYQRGTFRPKALLRRVLPQRLYEELSHRVQQRRAERLASLGFRTDRVRFVEHHLSHAAAAYYGWGRFHEPILILTNDGMGDEICATVSVGENGRIERIASVPYSESVAELYALTTYLMGMVPLEHEYKLMGMAPYAPETRATAVRSELERLVTFNGDGGLTWHRREGVPPLSESYRLLEKIYRRQRFDYICGGLQQFVELFLARWVRNAVRKTGIRKVALSGGIFMNVKANKILLEMDEIEELFVFPSCSDETNSIGAAYSVYAEEKTRSGKPLDIQPLSDLYWGRPISDEEVEASISRFAFSHRIQVEHLEDVEKRVAEFLAKGQIVARFKGRMEFGARALGNRSILANAADTSVIRTINAMIKNRDFWMPFAPSVKAESSRRYLIKPKPVPAPYMILSFDTVREKVPVFEAGVHPYDLTARPQEVTAEQNPDYYKLIGYFGELTGEDIILNTSFNLHGFPIVYHPDQALQTFNDSGLEHLAIGNFLISKR